MATGASHERTPVTELPQAIQTITKVQPDCASEVAIRTEPQKTDDFLGRKTLSRFLPQVRLSCKLSGNFKDVRANCFCASLLRTQMHTRRHTRARALSNKMKNDRADGHCVRFAWI